jgi:hypothetical protein
MSEPLIRPFTRELDGHGCFPFQGHSEALARLKVNTRTSLARRTNRRNWQWEICINSTTDSLRRYAHLSSDYRQYGTTKAKRFLW